MISRCSIILLTTLVSTVTALGQSSWHLFAGLQFDQLDYSAVSDEQQQVHVTGSAQFEQLANWGVQGGASFVSTERAAAFKGSLILYGQVVTTAYSISLGYYGLGGSNSTTRTGELEERFTVVEAPLQLSLEPSPGFRIDMGFAPWALLDVRRHDVGVEESSWWVYTVGSGDTTVTFNERDHEMKTYSRYGFAGVFGLAAIVKERLLVSASASISLTPVHLNKQPYAGHHSLLRLSLGYVLRRRSAE